MNSTEITLTNHGEGITLVGFSAEPHERRTLDTVRFRLRQTSEKAELLLSPGRHAHSIFSIIEWVCDDCWKEIELETLLRFLAFLSRIEHTTGKLTISPEDATVVISFNSSDWLEEVAKNAHFFPPFRQRITRRHGDAPAVPDEAEFRHTALFQAWNGAEVFRSTGAGGEIKVTPQGWWISQQEKIVFNWQPPNSPALVPLYEIQGKE